MHSISSKLKTARVGDRLFGFVLEKREFAAGKNADLYTLRHEKTGAELLYFDRTDENKTFAIGFKTLPEDDTGVFHILEHSVLNGSKKFPVKEPFVSLLQSSMQTFLNAMTFSDKTLYPVSSRNEADFFNLMAVYLDAVFCPAIYERPEIFMQEGWHYEFESENESPYYNGVVFSEMKGAFAEVDSLMNDEMNRLLYPDTCYGFVSGGDPAHIPELSYGQFVATHRRFYHPTNAKIFLDGRMDIDCVLAYIDSEYLSHYDRREPDFDFTPQEPKVGENTVYYEAQEGEESLCHMALGKLLCTHSETETLYAARVLADYLTGSNEAPLKRAFLEKGLAQDVELSVSETIYQPNIVFLARNTAKENFETIRTLLPQAVETLLGEGLDKKALAASLERQAFQSREITEPYGVELSMKLFDGWLYGDDPLTHVENAAVFDSLREKLAGDYFETLLRDMLASADDKCVLYVLPSLTKGEDDARCEAEKLAAATVSWSESDRRAACDAFVRMQQWQQSEDDEQALASLPHLELSDVAETVEPIQTELLTVGERDCLRVVTETNGVAYLRLYFDLSDFTAEELRLANVVTVCLGELRTAQTSAAALQTRIKTLLGSLSAKIELAAKPGALDESTPYLVVSASMLERNSAEALALIAEIVTQTRFDEADKLGELLAQTDYFQKQDLISSGHMYAVTKALSAFSQTGAQTELLEGESFARWFSDYVERFSNNGAELADIAARAIASNRLFIGCCGLNDDAALSALVDALPQGASGERQRVSQPDTNAENVEIPAAVGFSALGHNIYALGGRYSGACSVLSALMSYGYLWGAVRVQGGAYGTGMNIRQNGDMFCYSYRDPNLKSTRAAFAALADAMEAMLADDMPLDDVIISTVNTTDPLLDPAGLCALACARHLKGVTHADIEQIRREILHTTADDLRSLTDLVRRWLAEGKFCAVGDRSMLALLSE